MEDAKELQLLVLKEVKRMYGEVHDCISLIDEQEEAGGYGPDPRDCTGLATRVRKELNHVMADLRASQRTVPCLRNSAINKPMRTYHWALNFTLAEPPLELFSGSLFSDELKDVFRKVICSSEAELRRLNELYDVDANEVLFGEGNVPELITPFPFIVGEEYVKQTPGWHWVRVAPKQCVSIFHGGVGLRFHASSAFEMAKLLNWAGDFGAGCRVSARKVAQFLAVCGHANHFIASFNAEEVCEDEIHSSFSAQVDLDALPSATQGLATNFNIATALQPVNNPFADRLLRTNTRDHLNSVGTRYKIRTLQRETKNGLQRLHRRIERLRKFQKKRDELNADAEDGIKNGIKNEENEQQEGQKAPLKVRLKWDSSTQTPTACTTL